MTLQSVSETIKQLEFEQMDWEMNIMLSDNWNIYKIIKNGGIITKVGDKYYAIDASFFKLRF
jgi:hypothetical protein